VRELALDGEGGDVRNVRIRSGGSEERVGIRRPIDAPLELHVAGTGRRLVRIRNERRRESPRDWGDAVAAFIERRWRREWLEGRNLGRRQCERLAELVIVSAQPVLQRRERSGIRLGRDRSQPPGP